MAPIEKVFISSVAAVSERLAPDSCVAFPDAPDLSFIARLCVIRKHRRGQRARGSAELRAFRQLSALNDTIEQQTTLFFHRPASAGRTAGDSRSGPLKGADRKDKFKGLPVPAVNGWAREKGRKRLG